MKTWRTAFLWLLLCALLGAGLPAQAAEPSAKSSMTQIGVIDALLAGGYDGSVAVRGLPRFGDIGLGTFDALDGEMVILDGVVYQVPSTGVVRRADPRGTTPFAQVVRFKPGRAQPTPENVGLKDLESWLDKTLGDTNVFGAVRIEGVFTALKARSVPRQQKPYQPLAVVAKSQSVFEFAQVRGTLVGLRGPDYVRGLGVPGWHLHFLTQDRARGGHVLDLTLGSGTVRMASLRRFELLLPEAGLGGLDLAKDRAGELKAVESSR
ncbi:MAG: acetolactate decarboxylase [Humidesulfovibrio sp.]|uniref:acetolactate decarboxylase n=1 Tax=Humidesulfovibrio sp. TaxID=2910988 RepID=UPI0027EF2653|nr:acetolactate decarboxylase [Humidesulfovibrio sp.]MDQ7836261.1 acetolactate decarboxylase [Humidesulfovibrio sp.]